jgi:hypothetical protein
MCTDRKHASNGYCIAVQSELLYPEKNSNKNQKPIIRSRNLIDFICARATFWVLSAFNQHDRTWCNLELDEAMRPTEWSRCHHTCAAECVDCKIGRRTCRAADAPGESKRLLNEYQSQNGMGPDPSQYHIHDPIEIFSFVLSSS